MLCCSGSERAATVLSRLGVGAPSFSAIRASVLKRASASDYLPLDRQAAVHGHSVMFFIDNVQNQKRKTARARAGKSLKISPHIMRALFQVPANNQHFLAQFLSPLRQSPLPPLSLAVFLPTDRDNLLLRQFLERKLLPALARLLLSPLDEVEQKLKLPVLFHPDGIAAKVCVSVGCPQRFRQLYGTLKRICEVGG